MNHRGWDQRIVSGLSNHGSATNSVGHDQSLKSTSNTAGWTYMVVCSGSGEHQPGRCRNHWRRSPEDNFCHLAGMARGMSANQTLSFCLSSSSRSISSFISLPDNPQSRRLTVGNFRGSDSPLDNQSRHKAAWCCAYVLINLLFFSNPSWRNNSGMNGQSNTRPASFI